jgi:hypothetical protein
MLAKLWARWRRSRQPPWDDFWSARPRCEPLPLERGDAWIQFWSRP